jgi:hypothetical protein
LRAVVSLDGNGRHSCAISVRNSTVSPTGHAALYVEIDSQNAE